MLPLFRLKKEKYHEKQICYHCSSVLEGLLTFSSFATLSCRATENTNSEDANIPTEPLIIEYSNRDKDSSWDEDSATKIELSDTKAEIDGEGASFQDNTLLIYKAGTYLVSGGLTDGQIKISVTKTEKIQLFPEKINISCSDNSPILIEQADRVFITLVSGSKNTLTDGSQYTLADGEDEPDAIIFSKDDLTINGEGSFTIDAKYNHAIYSKNDLIITSGKYNITSINDRLKGKDRVAILDGKFEINAGGDVISSNNADAKGKGYVSINEGSFNI